MQAELEKLLDLQAKDLALIETDVRLKGILDQLAAFEAELDGRRREVTVARTRLDDVRKRRDELEVRIESYRVIQDRRRQRLEMARGAREAQAMITEVEMARSVLLREEGEWIKVADQVTEAERAVQALEERVAELETAQAAERVRLAGEQAALETERELAVAGRRQAADAVERSLRTRYDRLRSVRNVEVVVPLRGEACGACFTAVPRNRRSQIRAGILLDNCEACGVILYADDQG